eukprot:3334888-Amphidinium_carterae.1
MPPESLCKTRALHQRMEATSTLTFLFRIEFCTTARPLLRMYPDYRFGALSLHAKVWTTETSPCQLVVGSRQVLP